MWKVRKCKGGGVRGSGVRMWKCKGGGVRGLVEDVEGEDLQGLMCEGVGLV